MSTIDDLRVGDVVHATRFVSWTFDGPIWFVVAALRNDVGVADAVLLIDARGILAGEETILEDEDTFEVIPPDEVPEHVHIALMKLNLGARG